MTSDNVSPRHLMDIKRVAFETKPLNRAASAKSSVSASRRASTDKRKEITEIVDRFLRKKLSEPVAESGNVELKPLPTVDASPVKTIIHELRTVSEVNAVAAPVDFVSEDDVRRAVNKGEKIAIHAKTILTPSARDLGEEKDIFVR